MRGPYHRACPSSGTIDDLKRDVARWLVVVLRDPGVVRVQDDPLRVRLVDHYSR